MDALLAPKKHVWNGTHHFFLPYVIFFLHSLSCWMATLSTQSDILEMLESFSILSYSSHLICYWSHINSILTYLWNLLFLHDHFILRWSFIFHLDYYKSTDFKNPSFIGLLWLCLWNIDLIVSLLWCGKPERAPYCLPDKVLIWHSRPVCYSRLLFSTFLPVFKLCSPQTVLFNLIWTHHVLL